MKQDSRGVKKSLSDQAKTVFNKRQARESAPVSSVKSGGHGNVENQIADEHGRGNMKVMSSLIDRKTFRMKGKKYYWPLFFMALPFVLFVFVFSYIPLFGWAYAFFKYTPGLPWSKTPFVGFYFFKLMFSGTGELLGVLRNTLIFNGLGYLCSPLPAILAIMLTEVRSSRFKRIVQTTTTLPNYISWIIIFSISFALFSQDGLLNTLLMNLNVVKKPINILGNVKIVWYFQTAIGLWKGLGWGSVLYLAAIAGIDSELYDAARVDGAGRFRCILHITIPGILPTYVVLLILAISSMLSAGFDQYFMFYNPLVAENIETLDYYVYRVGIVLTDYSYSIAIGMFKTLFSITLLFAANRLAERVRGSKIF
jgi:putative aldouronate transport system permease protein